jgi:hypothetical protein
MLPIDQELRSGESSLVDSMSVEECNTLCSSNTSCRVASFNEDRICYHYMGSQLGIWKSSKLTNGSQWFAKLQNRGTRTYLHKNTDNCAKHRLHIIEKGIVCKQNPADMTDIN